MIQPQTQTREYWEHEFSVTDADIELIQNHFLETIRPQTTEELVDLVMHQRVAAEKRDLLRRVTGRAVYQPQDNYAVGDKLVFPVFNFAPGEVTAVRAGNNPQIGEFNVITVKMGGRTRQFASSLNAMHAANLGDGGLRDLVDAIDAQQIATLYRPLVEPALRDVLEKRGDFLYLGGKWFIRELLVEVNIGHLHLAEAVLDMSGGGPLATDEILPHLDMDRGLDNETLTFSLNNALLNDNRFDEVAPKNHVKWFLRRMEPDAVRSVLPRLQYDPLAYDHNLVNPPHRMLERELADEWSDLESNDFVKSITFSLIYPHRLMGTLPLNSTIRNLLPLGRSPRQMFTARDAETGEEFPVWVVKAGRYIYGLKTWYEQNEIVVGAYITVSKGDQPHVLLINYDRRPARREDVRQATVVDGRLRFDLQRRRVGCGYDDLLAVGTDYTAAIDAVWQRAEARPLVQLIAVLLPELTALSPQNAVHAKTIYSIVNMIKRVPPGPLFAELVRQPVFVPVGDVYWTFDAQRLRRD